MSWLFLTAITVVTRSLYGLMTKVLSNRVKGSAYTQALLLTLSGALISIIVTPVIGEASLSLNGASLQTVGLVALSQGLGNIVYFAAIKNLTSGTAQIAFSSVLVFNTLLAVVFLNLGLSALNIVGIILLMLAILSVTSGKIEFSKKGVLLMIIAAFLFAVYQLSSGVISKQVSLLTYLLISYLGASVVIFLSKVNVIVSDLRAGTIKSDFKISFITALFSVANFVAAYFAYRIAPEPAKVAMLVTAQVVLTVFLGYFILKERGGLARKLAAAVLVMVSATLIIN